MADKASLLRELHSLDSKIQVKENELARLKKQRTKIAEKITRCSLIDHLGKEQEKRND